MGAEWVNLLVRYVKETGVDVIGVPSEQRATLQRNLDVDPGRKSFTWK